MLHPPHVIDAYAVLGVEAGSDIETAKLAWRKLANQYHGAKDSSSEAEEKLKAVNLAWSVIKSYPFIDRRPGKRQEKPKTATKPNQTSTPPFSQKRDSDEESSKQAGCHTTRGKETEGGGSKQAENLRRDVTISICEAAFGAKATLRGKTVDPCEGCGGTGLAKAKTACDYCDGLGRKQYGAGGGLGMMCMKCNGDGQVFAPCTDCKGTGKGDELRSYTFIVKTPPGLLPGQVLRGRGNGKRGSSAGLNGDLMVNVRVGKKDEDGPFRLDSSGAMTVEVPVNALAWLSGWEGKIPSLWGLVDINVPQRTSTLTLEHKGFPIAGKPVGPLTVIFRVVYPEVSSEKDQAVLKTMAACYRCEEEVLAIESHRKLVARFDRYKSATDTTTA